MFHSKEEQEKFIEVYNDTLNYPTISDVADEMGFSPRTVRRRASHLHSHSVNVLINRKFVQSAGQQGSLFKEMDDELVEENVRLAKQKQKQQDFNRVERKSFREHARVENAIDEYVNSMVKTLEENSFNFETFSHDNSDSQSTGIIQISDLHLNEEINIPGGNQYNFQIASARLKEFVKRAKAYFLVNDITDVVVAMTGDILNSDRRFDEMLTNATNRANATFLAVDIIQQVLRDLNEEFNLKVISITGNESRIDKDVGWETALAQNNFDFMVHNMLSYLFTGKDGIEFVQCEESPLERVIEINGSNVLIVHGHNGLATNPEKKIQSKIMYYNSQGITIDYTIMGHVHSAQIGDQYARSSGLPGSNSYSHNALNLTGRASQNIYIFHENKTHDCIKIDLQNVNDNDYYPYNSELESYNNKLNSDNIKQETVFKVVI